MPKTKHNGSTLIEALIAIAILAQVIIIALALISSTTRIASVTRNKFQCLGYAQDAVEKIRNIRDTNLKSGMSFSENIKSGRVAITKDDDAITGNKNNFITIGATDPNDLEEMSSKFTRQVDISSPGIDILQVDVQVNYSAGKKCSISEQLTNWRKQP